MQDALERMTRELRLSDEVVDDLRSLQRLGSLTLAGAETGDPRLRYFLWHANVLDGSPTAIVSSRVGRELDKKDEYFRVLRVACSQLNPQTQSLITSAGSTTHSFVTRAAELFGLNLCIVDIAKTSCSLKHWTRHCLSNRVAQPSIGYLHVSPCLLGKPIFPLRDAVPIFQAAQVLAIHLRSGGNIQSLIKQRLQSKQPSKVFLALGHQQLVSSKTAGPLLKAGAIGWLPLDSTHVDDPISIGQRSIEAKSRQPITTLRDLDRTSGYLTHCTRGVCGPWPEQDNSDFLDELILGSPTRDRSAFSRLMRILSQRRILASSEAIRGSTSALSFTAADLNEIPSLRCFRSHRGRWDFEPYGISIDKEFLESQGARRVIYGTESTWQAMADEDKPFFQRLGESKNSIDWSIEQEFRLPHDLDLELVPSNSARVFVATSDEAKHVAKISHWPVFVMQQH